MKPYLKFLDGPRKQLQKFFPILIVSKDRLALVATGGDVVVRTGILRPRQTVSAKVATWRTDRSKQVVTVNKKI